MCGIAGIFDSFPNKTSVLNVRNMCDSLAHRGPDGEGFWTSSDGLLTLGHRRLSIIDLSEKGAQPMSYLGKYHITFNGEIYNYQSLKKELTTFGYSFESATDTEVVLAAFDYWKEDCFHRFDGMFAFAIYDETTYELYCARDRFGEKPFYYTLVDGVFYFASEIKAFWAIEQKKKINKHMMYLFLIEDLVENPTNLKETFYENIYQLPPASYFKVTAQSLLPNPTIYWEITVSDNLKNLTFEAAVSTFKNLFQDAVSSRNIGDVTVGCSLSGGLDSSSIVATVAKNKKEINTFSARFEDFHKDEGSYIRLVSDKFETIQHEAWISGTDFENAFDRLLYYQDEPFQSGSIFAQFAVYEQARKNNVPVVLDGQGADELLGGYDKDFTVFAKEIFNDKKALTLYRKQMKENHAFQISLGYKDILSIKLAAVYRFIGSVKNRFFSKKPNGIPARFHKQYAPKKPLFTQHNSLKNSLKHEMTVQGLPKLLRFADRNAMAHSVEARLPFLSPELVSFVFQLNSAYFLHKGWSKAILRAAMEEVLPPAICYRKDKIGFEAPQHNWLHSTHMQKRLIESRQLLIKTGYITESYSDNWKILIAAYYVN